MQRCGRWHVPRKRLSFMAVVSFLFFILAKMKSWVRFFTLKDVSQATERSLKSFLHVLFCIYFLLKEGVSWTIKHWDFWLRNELKSRNKPVHHLQLFKYQWTIYFPYPTSSLLTVLHLVDSIVHYCPVLIGVEENYFSWWGREDRKHFGMSWTHWEWTCCASRVLPSSAV